MVFIFTMLGDCPGPEKLSQGPLFSEQPSADCSCEKKWGLGSCLLTVACIMMVGLAPALAQSFPYKNVSLVVPFPPGGGPDLMARVFAEKLATQWGKPVVVENRPGASALLGAQALAKSPADGHTLLLTTNTMVISPHVLAPGAGGGIDVHTDLLPIVAPATTPMAFLANPSLNVKDLPSALACCRRSNIDHLCRLNFDQGLLSAFGLLTVDNYTFNRWH